MNLHIWYKINAGVENDVELLSIRSVEEILTDDDIVHLRLTAIDVNERNIVQYDVERDCALKEFIEEKGITFARGLAFYEFTHSVESITEDKELIIMSKVCISGIFCIFAYYLMSCRRQINFSILALDKVLRNFVTENYLVNEY